MGPLLHNDFTQLSLIHKQDFGAWIGLALYPLFSHSPPPPTRVMLLFFPSEAQLCIREVYPGKQHRWWSFIKLMKHDSITLFLKNTSMIHQLAPGQKISQESRKDSAKVLALEIFYKD